LGRSIRGPYRRASQKIQLDWAPDPKVGGSDPLRHTLLLPH
jgi:hypothetical protein